MLRVISRTLLRVPHFCLRSLHFWYLIILLKTTLTASDTLERTATSSISTQIPESLTITTNEGKKKAGDMVARTTSSYTHIRALKQQQGRSESAEVEYNRCSEIVGRSYNESSQTWQVTNTLLSEVGRDLQRIVDCATADDIIYFDTNGTIQLERTLNVSVSLTLRGASGTTLTCPQQGALLISRASSFTIENLTISECNGTTSILVLSPSCVGEGRNEDIIQLRQLTFQDNDVFDQGHLIDTIGQCAQLNVTGLVLLRNRCVRTHCMVLGIMNTLTNVYLDSNQGSRRTSLDAFSLFASHTSETSALNVTSINNEIRSFHVSNGDLRITKSRFDGNRRDQSSGTGDDSVRGGTIFAIQSSISISNTTFERNCALHGGSLFLSDGSNATISSCSFINNTSINHGGAILLQQRSRATFTHTIFEGNEARSRGGALSLQNRCNVLITNCNFTNNTSDQQGGALRLEGDSITVLADSTFEGNEARGDGGALFLWSVCEATITNCRFNNNKSNQSGGTLRLESSSTTTLRNSTFEGNKAGWSGGGLFLWSSCAATITNCRFTNNTSNQYGGAFRLEERSIANVAHSTFEGNEAHWRGGAIFLRRSCDATISNCNFNSNTAFNHGGAISLFEHSTTALKNLTFKENKTLWRGGALSLAVFCNATISNCSFSNNVAIHFGGAMRLEENSTTNLADSTFEGNEARWSGGAIFLWGACDAAITNCHFNNNTSDENGGALRLEYNSSTTMTSSTFKGNEALWRGGALSLEDNCTAMLTYGGLAMNKASISGGGIDAIYASRINASNVDIVSNTAEDMGGGIAIVNASSLLCRSCMILNNRAFSGAGLYAYSNNSIRVVAQLSNSRFENNSAQSHGGGIEFAAPQNRTINCSKDDVTCGCIVLLSTNFEDNFANHSGAIVLTTDPDRVRVNCDWWGDENHEYFNETEINKLEVVDPHYLCSSWKRNRVSNWDCGDVVGTYGQEIKLRIASHDEVRLVGNRTSGYTIENVGGAKPLPNITFSTFDVYGAGPAPTLPYSFEARLSSPNGFFRGLYAATIHAGSGNFSNVVGFVIPGNYTLEISSDHPALQTINVTVIVRACRVGEEPTRDNLICQTCDNFTYNFNPSNAGGCKECPNDATCVGRYIVPKKGHWHNNPCHDQVKQCLIEDACEYENRQDVLTNFTQNLTNCDFNEATLEAYRDDLCNEGYEDLLCGSCKSSFGLSFLFQCLKCPRKGIAFLTIVAVTLYLLFISSFTIRGCLPFDAKRAEERSRRIMRHESRANSIRDPEINVEMVRMIVEGHVPPEYFRRKQEASTSHAPEDSVQQE